MFLTLLHVKRLIDSTVGKDAGCQGSRRVLGVLCRAGEEATATAIGGCSSGPREARASFGGAYTLLYPAPPGHFSHPMEHWQA